MHEAYAKFGRNINDKMWPFMPIYDFNIVLQRKLKIEHETLALYRVPSIPTLARENALSILAAISLSAALWRGNVCVRWCTATIRLDRLGSRCPPFRRCRRFGSRMSAHSFLYLFAVLVQTKLYVTLIGRICVICSCGISTTES